MLPKPLDDRRCVFCDRRLSLHTVMGRHVCSSCWEIIAIIALKAVGTTIERKFDEAVESIENGE